MAESRKFVSIAGIWYIVTDDEYIQGARHARRLQELQRQYTRKD